MSRPPGKLFWCPKEPGVYLIRNLINGNLYVGSTINIYVRFKDHSWALKSNKHYATHLQRAWNKYGEDAFSFEVISLHCNANELQVAEQLWIDALRPEYNSAPNAYLALGRKLPESGKQKLREFRLGKKLPRDVVEKMAASKRGIPVRPEVLAARLGKRQSSLHIARRMEKLNRLHRDPSFCAKRGEAICLGWKKRKRRLYEEVTEHFIPLFDPDIVKGGE